MVSLKQIEAMSKYMTPKQLEEALHNALNEQETIVNTEITEVVSKKRLISFDEALSDGGVCQVEVLGKKYNVSVFTPEMMQDYDNKQFILDDGYEVNLPPLYKFHIRSGAGCYVTVKAQTYDEAQTVIDFLFGKGRYKVSASKI